MDASPSPATRGWCWRPPAWPCSPCSSTPRSCSSPSPSIRADFSDVSPSSLSWVLNAYTIVFAALLIPAGRLADRIGRRRTFLAAVVALHGRVDALRPGARRRAAGRRPDPAGRRRGRPGAGVAGAGAADLPTREGPGRRRDLGRGRRGRRCRRPDARRAVVENLGWRWAFFINLPVGHRQLRRSAGGCCPKVGRRTPAGCPTRSASCCWPAGWRLDGVRHRADRRLGLDEHRVPRHDARRRGRCIALFVWRCSTRAATRCST